ncbi:hypothetical protein ACEPPZ_16415 [Paracoccus yeei]|uniref:hypothetical protein n=1 Tax=Paracoccus yeei TaxID=147645 RepID=UPI0037D8951B
MGLNMDFCFADARAILVLAGWSADPWLDLELHAEDARLSPVLVTRHARRDLRTAEPMGYLAVFDLGGLDLPGNAAIHLRTGHEFTELSPERLVTDELRLIEVGVDEVFFAWLRLVGQGTLNAPKGETAQAVMTRLRFAPLLARESDDFGLGTDRCLVGEAGQGLVSGWIMPAQGQTEALTALAMDDRQLCRVELMPGALPRADLQPYATRYRFSGTDGFCGSFLLAEPASGPVRVLFLIPGQHAAAGVLVAAEPTPAAALAVQTCQVQLELPDPTRQTRLRRAMLEPLPAWQPPSGVAPVRAGRVLLVLDHDLPDADLRDVLRRVGLRLDRPLELFLLRPGLTRPLAAAVEGAQRDLPQGLVLRGTGMALDREAPMAELALYGRSSTLFQLDEDARVFDATLRRQPVQLSILDPIFAVAGGDPGQRFLRDQLAFALSAPTALLRPLLAQAPRAYLTEEARLRDIARHLLGAGAAHAEGLAPTRHFAGKSGPLNQPLPGGLDLHTFDAESRALMEALSAA